MTRAEVVWILKICDLALTRLPKECLNIPLDRNSTGTLDLHDGLLSIKTTVQYTEETDDETN